MRTNQSDFDFLVKRGRIQEARKLVEEDSRQAYSMSYPSFMEDMLKKYRKSRKYVSQHTGLSLDYLYKILQGKKKPNRDYVLAICIGTGMDIVETEHALTINSLAGLDNADKRNTIIRKCILERLSIDDLDETLEELGLEPIRVSPDMKKSDILIRKEDIASARNDQSDPASAVTEESAQCTNRSYVISDDGNIEVEYGDDGNDEDYEPYTEVERIVKAERVPCMSPFDYNYWAIITVKDRNGNLFYVEGFYGNDNTVFLVLDEQNHKLADTYGDMLEGIESVQSIERYSSLYKASASPFFSFYLDIEKATDIKCRETMQALNDSRSLGIRHSRRLGHGEDIIFGELFNDREPEKLEYLQVRIYSDGKKSFTVSHHSYFMQFFLADFYPMYFGEPEKEEYFLETDDLKKLKGNDEHYSFFFACILNSLCDAYSLNAADDGEPKDPDITMLEDELSRLRKDACSALHSGDSKGFKQLLLKAEEKIAFLESKGQNKLADHVINLYKLLSVAVNESEWIKTAEQIGALRGQLLERMKAGEDLDTVAGVMAETLLVLVHGNHENFMSPKTAKAYDEDALAIIDLIKDKKEKVLQTLYQLYVSYSFLIDGDEPEKAVELLEKATDLCSDLGYDNNPDMMINVSSMHYNRGWVLWHRLKNDEALIYYGYALDCAERYFKHPGADKISAVAELEHIGKGILEFYQETGKSAPAERLRKRLAKLGVIL